MRWLAALLLALLSMKGLAATAYVSDELVLGVYAEENNQGQRLATLHSGTSLETLAQNGDFTQVRLSDGTTGWVKSAFLTARGGAGSQPCHHTGPGRGGRAQRSRAAEARTCCKARRVGRGASRRSRTGDRVAGDIRRAGGNSCGRGASMAGDHRHRGCHRAGMRFLAGVCHAGAARTRQIRGDQSLLNPGFSGSLVT